MLGLRHKECHQPLVGKTSGFTLIELVIVLVLLGVLATVAAARFQGRSGYAEYTFQNRLVSALRNMQTRAMQDSRDGFCHQINFQYGVGVAAFGPPSADFTSGNQAQTCLTSINFSTAEFLRTDAGEVSDESVSMASSDGAATSISFIGFDSLGRPLSSANNCSGNAGCQVSFSGEETVSVCVEQEGYIHAC